MQEKSNKKNTFIKVFAVALFLCGVAFFMYPYATRWYAGYRSDKVMDSFEKDLKEMKDLLINNELKGQIIEDSNLQDKNDENEIIAGEDLEKENLNSDDLKKLNDLKRLYKDMLQYNERLYKDGQKDLKDPFSYEVHSIDLTEYGFKNNVVGIISIPKIDVSMPMYLGANKSNMTKGAVTLGETSMPTGGKNTNCVIAAHRGYKGIKMFRDIEELSIGDRIKITTAWEELEYEVTEIDIVEKDDIDKVFIRTGEDMITLLTCHPYTKNTHRYLVFAKRVKGDMDEGNGDVENNTIEGEETNITDTENSNKNIGDNENNKDNSGEKIEKSFSLQIWLEKYLPIIGIGVIVILIITGVKCNYLKR
ncbi:MAG: class C sortase [Lachnospiraceae bacterium]|nr:class C sortase [Lachnospiraceae bacterium]